MHVFVVHTIYGAGYLFKPEMQLAIAIGKKLGEAFLLAPQQHTTAVAVRMRAAKPHGLRKGGLIDHRREE